MDSFFLNKDHWTGATKLLRNLEGTYNVII